MESGHTPSRKHPEYWGGTIPWIGIGDARAQDGKRIYDTEEKTNEEGIANSSARVLPENTVCLSRTASVGYVVVMGRPMATSQDFVNWVCSPRLDPEFLKYLFIAEGDDLLRFASGAVHQTIYFPEAKGFHICHPPLAEQQRIVAVLDEAFAGIATAKANAEKNLQNARELFDASLQTVFKKIEHSGADLIPLEKLTEASSPITYGVVKPGTEGEIAFVRGGDLSRGLIRTEQLRTITKAVSDQYRRTLLRGGELLISLVGQPGQVAVVPMDLAGANIARQVGLIRLSAGISARFVMFYLRSPTGQCSLGARESGSVQQVINLGELRQVVVPVPARDDQDAVVAKLDAALAEIRRLEQIYTRKIVAFDELKQSLLNKAFAGELT